MRLRLRLRRGPPVAFLDSKKPGFRWGPSWRRFPRCQHSQRSAPLYEARRHLPSGSVARKERSFFCYFSIFTICFSICCWREEFQNSGTAASKDLGTLLPTRSLPRNQKKKNQTLGNRTYTWIDSAYRCHVSKIKSLFREKNKSC